MGIKVSSLTSIVLNISRAFCHLLYPQSCLHCHSILDNSTHILCHSCLELMEIINAQERCTLCFSPDCDTQVKLCVNCIQYPQLFDGMAAVFDFLGPAATLIKKMKYANMPYLTEGMAAYLVTQFVQLDWPMPDVVVPVPISFTHLLGRGYNQSALLSRFFANIIKCPMQEILKRRSGDFSQAGLNRSQRLLLDSEKFGLKKNIDIQNKTILLIDDVMTTGSTLNRCAEVLKSLYPKKIYGIVFCRAI